jgi:prepilin-type processing-associated H-X9-DG protein
MIRFYKNLFVCVVLCLSIGFVCSGAAVAQSSSAEKLATVLPDDVLAFLATSGADDLKPAFEKTILGQIWNDPQVQTFYQAIYKELMTKLEQEISDPNANQDVNTVLKFAGLIKTRPVIIGAAQKQTQQGPPVYAFAILDAGPRKTEIATALKQLESLAGEGDIIEIKIGSAMLHGPKDADNVPGYWGWVGNYLVFAINDGEGLAIKYLQAAPVDRPKPNYLQKVPGSDDVLAFYMNTTNALNLFGTVAKMGGKEDKFVIVQAVIKELGFDQVKTITSRIGFDGPDVVVNELVEIPQPRTGLFANFKTIDMKMFDMVDARAMTTTAVNYDLAGIYDTVLKAVNIAAGEDSAKIQEAIAKIEDQLKFRIREGLLASLEGRMIFYVLPGGIQGLPLQGGFVLIANLKDAKLWEETMAGLEKFVSEKSPTMVQFSSQVQNGKTLHTWAIIPLAVAQIMPTWAISGDKVIIASNPATCNMAIEQADSGKNSIRSTEGFAKVTAKLPDNLLALKYGDSKVQFTQMMTGLQQFWPLLTLGAANAGVKLPIILPSLTQISEKMGPSCQYCWYDNEGIRSYYRGVGVEQSIGAVAGAAVGIGVAMPAMAKARNQAQRIVSMNNLKRIGLASLMYANDHNDIFPANFEQMKSNIDDPKILNSPLKPKDFTGPSYIYVAGQNMSMDPGNILAYENPAYCRDGLYVLFLDGHVEWMRPDQFIKELKATYQRLGKEMPEIKFKD